MRERAVKAVRAQSFRWGTWLAVAVVAATTLSGCAVNESDIDRWKTTEHGPDKLYAVVTHSKYSWELRDEATMALVSTPAREGDFIGLRYLVDGVDLGEGQRLPGALAALSDDDRKRIVGDIAPQLIDGMKLRPPPKQDLVLPDGTKVPAKCTLPPPDPSIAFKDATFALVSATNPRLVTDEKVMSDLVAGLVAWAQTDFEARIDNVNQQYATETVLRWLHTNNQPAVASLPDLIRDGQTKLDHIISLIGDLGDDATKAKASGQVVNLAKTIDSKAWLDAHTKTMTEVCKGKAIAVEALTAQAQKDQAGQLEALFGYMNRLGGRPVIDYALSVADDPKHDPALRTDAVAALKGVVFKDPKDPSNTKDVDGLITVIKDPGAQQQLRLLAAQRLLEAPKDLITATVVPRLYTAFDAAGDRRDARFVMGWTIIQATGMDGIDKFMSHLPTSSDSRMSLNEAIGYGQTITDLLDPKKTIKIDKLRVYINGNSMGAKLAALGAFFEERGADMNLLRQMAQDTTKVPTTCDDTSKNPADKCGWSDPGCWVPKAGGGPNDKEHKVIATVGDFVSYCIIPNVPK
jgi:hypothetical protein